LQVRAAQAEQGQDRSPPCHAGEGVEEGIIGSEDQAGAEGGHALKCALDQVFADAPGAAKPF